MCSCCAGPINDIRITPFRESNIPTTRSTAVMETNATITSTSTYNVEGMTCGHCVSAITSEVSKIPAVSDVDVDLTAGTVTVTGNGVNAADVRAAVDEAGYTVAS